MRAAFAAIKHPRTQEESSMRSTTPGTVAGFLLLTLACQATAQTPRYVLRDLPKPADALYCTGAASINDQGDVAMNCTYKGGTRSEAARWCLTSHWCIPFTARIPWSYTLPTIWQANGTVRTLNFTTRSSSWDVFMLNSGAVLASGTPLDTDGRNTGGGGYWIWQAGSNVAEPYATPASLPSREVSLFSIRRNGLAQWDRLDGSASYMLTPDGEVSPVPQIPASSDVLRYRGDTFFNDQGMRVVTRWVEGPPTLAEPFGAALPQAWFFNGQQWTRMKLPDDLNNLQSIRINAKGHVVAHDRYDVRYLWRADQPGRSAPCRAQPCSASAPSSATTV
jgi:hypothetical protein